MLTQTDPNGLTLTFDYDQNGNVVSQRDSLGGVVNSTYDKDNRLLSRSFSDAKGNQGREDLQYNADGLATGMVRYADAAGTVKVGSTVEGYDQDNRVTLIANYDGAGNAGGRLASETDNGTTTYYGYDANNQLISAGSTVYDYDAAGNPTNPGFVVGPDNQLLSDGTWN